MVDKVNSGDIIYASKINEIIDALNSGGGGIKVLTSYSGNTPSYVTYNNPHYNSTDGVWCNGVCASLCSNECKGECMHNCSERCGGGCVGDS